MRDAGVLCLHGLGRTASDWDGVREGLARYGTVHMPQLPRATFAELVAADLPRVDLNGGLWWVVGPDGKRRP
jgi:hypothetical protein